MSTAANHLVNRDVKSDVRGKQFQSVKSQRCKFITFNVHMHLLMNDVIKRNYAALMTANDS